ncbi:hypothetical protein L3X38_008488 [Prunus dulcis]|uniref:Uncharacterized protein n=1 Tax=Prunus dulcis TaxID=3755 RepID=A0AAD5F761_PRUDU|nr:hypothetical protein L3X38_008488 [Prunus dulcis]
MKIEARNRLLWEIKAILAEKVFEQTHFPKASREELQHIKLWPTIQTSFLEPEQVLALSFLVINPVSGGLSH